MSDISLPAGIFVNVAAHLPPDLPGVARQIVQICGQRLEVVNHGAYPGPQRIVHGEPSPLHPFGDSPPVAKVLTGNPFQLFALPRC
jgi:hypothetical protein